MKTAQAITAVLVVLAVSGMARAGVSIGSGDLVEFNTTIGGV